MTREEAIDTVKRVYEEAGGSCSESSFAASVAVWEALGMIKLDEPKSANERAVDEMFRVCEGGVLTPRLAMQAIDAVGLKIIEKGQ